MYEFAGESLANPASPTSAVTAVKIKKGFIIILVGVQAKNICRDGKLSGQRDLGRSLLYFRYL
jgi:hypothetical protein